ncbi:alpha/beta hydrolase [Mesorhizobium sp. CGMCC 1.15528]|uniref:Alpha/beta hydrolase n=1 Tax=Mesorhizobium zhangyense TaxID=1776730 RepID=A0A7C9V6J1_9HYPH|nr:alpha/beta hydrolase [Mesorhizobium zhangyense]NGN39886.1 alpha/beta hydrolase [Mesorhizobium zhangyense]
MNQAIVSRSAPAMSGFERAEYDIGGVRTVVHSLGKGRPLVFLHGAGTFPGFEFARLLAADARVIIPYHPGFGESADDEHITSIDDHVLHYADLFDRLGLAEFDLAGFSFGGWIAAEYAARMSSRLRRLALVAPAGLVVRAHPAPDLSIVAPHDLPGYLTHDPQVAIGYFPKSPDPAFDQSLGREMMAFGKLLGDEPQGNPKLDRWLHRIGVPTLLLWGSEDRMRPAAQASAWLNELPNARFEQVADAGHLLFEEKPQAAVAILRDFLAA